MAVPPDHQVLPGKEEENSCTNGGESGIGRQFLQRLGNERKKCGPEERPGSGTDPDGNQHQAGFTREEETDP